MQNGALIALRLCEQPTQFLKNLKMTKHYDIIIAGSGLAGLTLALELVKRPFFRDQQILLLDRDVKQKNDRTWCFWATDEEELPPVVFKTWDRCRFYGPDIRIPLDIAPFRYRMVRGLDFYNWAKTTLETYPNVQQLKTNILGIHTTPANSYPPTVNGRRSTANGQQSTVNSQQSSATVQTDLGDFTADWVFNSAMTKFPVVPPSSALYPNPPFTSPQSTTHNQQPTTNNQQPITSNQQPTGYTRLLQHFKGWLIETATPAFNPEVMTFMDYRLEQKGETRFVYVLPFSENQALVEFTVFSPTLCTAEEYQSALQQYVEEFLEIKDFRIVEEEFGVIPMTDDPFTPTAEGRVIHIGTAGGFVKASSGYAFKRTQRKLRSFAEAWEQTGAPEPALLKSDWQYRFFDSVMLRVLRENAVSGKDFFTQLFRELPAPLVLRFLDEDSTFAENIRLLSVPPTWPFLKTAWKQIPIFGKI